MAEFAQASNAWAKAWLDMQKQYMDTWMKFAPHKLPWGDEASPFASATPWAQSFEQWSKLFGQNLPHSAKDVSARLFDLGKSYLGMSESFWQLLQQGKDACEWSADWQRSVQESMKHFGKGFEFPTGVADPWSGFATLWGLPLSNWQRMACAFSPFPGELEKALREERVPEASELTRSVRHYLSVPPVGYTREWQQQLQDWTRLAIEYGHALQDFSALLGKVVQRALDLFGKRVTEKTKAGESFDGLRALYDLWIDCGEEAYAEQVATAEFPQLQAELVNALMRMKRHEQLIVEEAMTGLNIPTRREMDTTHQRVHELQHQVRQLEDLLQEAAEAAEEASHQPAAQARAVATRKKAPARKAAAKKTASTASRRAQPKTKARKG